MLCENVTRSGLPTGSRHIYSSKVRNKSFGNTTWVITARFPCRFSAVSEYRQWYSKSIAKIQTHLWTPLHPALFTLSSAKLQNKQHMGKFSSLTITQLALTTAKKRQLKACNASGLKLVNAIIGARKRHVLQHNLTAHLKIRQWPIKIPIHTENTKESLPDSKFMPIKIWC